MVVKSPFISEKPEDNIAKFKVRDENILRTITDYNTETGDINKILKLVSLTAVNKFPSTIIIRREPRLDGRGMRDKPASKAAWMLEDEHFNFGRSRVNQTFLDASCDLRLIKKMAALYVLHSNGYGYHFLESNGLLNQINLKFFVMDRLLKEDGTVLRNMLELLAENQSKIKESSVGERGRLLYEKILDYCENSKILRMTNAGTRDYMMGRIDELKRAIDTSKRKEKGQFVRRMEVMYEVRRDWLRWLGLVEYSEDRLTDLGFSFYSELMKFNLDQDFFDCKIISMLGKLFNLPINNDFFDLKSLEILFDKITTLRKLDILETFVLIDIYILSKIPNVVSDRDNILKLLVKASYANETRLIVQNGYRTNYYYVKSR